jgi:multisubunit Na+/H+ antiporter MnhB subunit
MGMTIDALLGLALLWLAWRVLNTADWYESVVLFVTFGLLMALVWMRLDAPDVAMAEAAIGAGLTGALLMSAVARLPQEQGMSAAISAEHAALAAAPAASNRVALPYRVLLGLLLLAAAAALGLAVAGLPPVAAGLEPVVQDAMPRSGVTHPVTAVLLNFRGYDTLLELVVLLQVAIAVRAMAPLSLRSTAVPISPVLKQLAQWLVPLLIVVSCYLLWTGSSSPGGAFQAGATLGGAGVLFMLGFPHRLRRLRHSGNSVLLSAGVLAFAAVALLGPLSGAALLTYPEGMAGPLILFVEAVATVSIAVTLMMLFAGPPRSAPQEPAA